MMFNRSSKSCYIIAEMSANHAGSYERAIEIIHAAKDAGADCIKIQTYTPDTMTIDCDNEYFKITKGTWKGENLYSLYGKAFTPWEWQKGLKEEADSIGIDFLSTPFDSTSVDFLENLGVEFYKIASFEITDLPLIKYIASKNKPIIMSTGMSTLGEIEEAITTIRSQGNNDITILKCTSSYPAISDDMNLKTIPVLKSTFNVNVGLSDHSLGSIGAITAVALGANVVEKHFCISRDIENPDASFSMEPKEFAVMVRDIREVEKAMGKNQLGATESERSSIVFRRSIFAVDDIKAGEKFTSENVRIIRPGYGIAPKHIDAVIDSKASMDIHRGTPLSWKMIE